MLAGPQSEMNVLTRSLLTSNCSTSLLTQAYRNTSGVFAREIIAWALMSIDAADVPRTHPNGVPEEVVAELKRLRLPSPAT